MTDSYDLIVKLRAIREFKPDPLSDDDLGAILEAARWTGSSKNSQDWSFIVVTGDRLQGLAEHGDYTDPIRASAATIVLVKEAGREPVRHRARSPEHHARGEDCRCRLVSHHPPSTTPTRGAFSVLPMRSRTRYAVALGYPTAGTAPSRFGGRKPSETVRQIRALLTLDYPDVTGSGLH